MEPYSSINSAHINLPPESQMQLYEKAAKQQTFPIRDLGTPGIFVLRNQFAHW